MARGYLGGVILGGVVGAAGLALLSQSLPLPEGAMTAVPVAGETGLAPDGKGEDAVPPAETAAPAAAASSSETQGAATAEPPAPEPTTPAEASAAPEAPAAPPAEPASQPAAEAAIATSPAAEPPAKPAPAPEAPAVVASAEPSAPEAPAAEAPAPETPAPEASSSEIPAPVSEEAADSASPLSEAAPAVTTLAPEAPAAAGPALPADAALPAGDAAPAPGGAPVLDAAAPAEDAGPVAMIPAGQPPALPVTIAPDLAPGDAGMAEAALLPPADLPPPGQAVVAELSPDTSASEVTPETADAPPPPPLTPEEEALLVPAPAAPTEGAPALIVPDEPPVAGQGSLPADPELKPEVAGVTTGRLPQIGAAEPGPATGDGAAVAAPDTRPLALFARPYQREDGKPLFAILLVDPGGPEVDRTTLAALPFPVSFVIDPMAPDAATAAAIYRAAGQEVIMAATGIPDGATAADLEQTFQAHARALPESVAVIDLPQDGLAANRPLAALAVPVIEAQGRGLITYDGGLNAGDQVARRAGLPAATVFRRLDAEGEAKPVIRRYLDRAAFKAAQDGRVAVIGSTRPETVAAILEWTVEGRAATVSLAPASAVLQAD